MANYYFAVLAIGRDTPGIVAGITGVLAEQHSCNMETSQMMTLGGHFALVMIVSSQLPVDPEKLQNDLAGSGGVDSDMHVHIGPIAPEDFRLVGGTEPSHRIFAVATDQSGLVHGMARVLSEASVNIGYLASQRHEVSPEPQCQIAMDVSLPGEMNEDALRNRLNAALPKGSELIIESARQRDGKS
jgi:glycine cleavage system regulatory protein